jgi:hypothetical protein
MVDEIARLSAGNRRADQETADALEHCLRLADQIEQSRTLKPLARIVCRLRVRSADGRQS